MEKLQNLLYEVIKKTDALKAAQTLYSRQLAPKFNPFDYISTNELGISQILADLLNPKGSHAQQEEFLILFIEHCLPSIYQDISWHPFIEHLQETKVYVEETTRESGTRRRMDIYLHCKVGNESYGICVENKPYAADQFEQLNDYAIELEQRSHKAWHLVYLNESDEGPSKYSIDPNKLEVLKEQHQYTHLRFSDLIYWLKACQVECQNHSVNEFLTQLIKFIQKQFMGIEDMNIKNTVLEVMQQSEENIEASLIINNNIERMKKELIEKLKVDLSEKIDALDFKFSVSEAYDGNHEEHVVFATIEDIGYIRLEFNGRTINSAFLGIKLYTSKAISTESAELIKELNTVFEKSSYNKKTKSSNWWPVHYDFEPRQWKTSIKPWQMIYTGEMAIKILEEVNEMYMVLEANGYKMR